MGTVHDTAGWVRLLGTTLALALAITVTGVYGRRVGAAMAAVAVLTVATLAVMLGGS